MTQRNLTVLITNIVLEGRTGTEIVTRDLALGLARLGHRPIIYTQTAGPIADELRRAGISVTTSIASITEPIDIIHGQHNPVAAVAVARFPNVPAIFMAHDYMAWHDAPPRLPSISRYLAVDETVAGRLVTELGPLAGQVSVHLNAVDIGRFLPGPELPDRPARALIFAKNVGHVAAIEAACRLRNIDADVVGRTVGKVHQTPETLLREYDLVFTSALSAIEAMACGRAVIVCDGRGLAGFVTPERFDAWRPLNFGLRAFTRSVTIEALVAEIDSYDAELATVVGERTRREANSDDWLAGLLTHYDEAIAYALPAVETNDRRALETALHLETWAPRFDSRWPWLAERQSLLDRIERLEQFQLARRGSAWRARIHGRRDWLVTKLSSFTKA